MDTQLDRVNLRPPHNARLDLAIPQEHQKQHTALGSQLQVSELGRCQGDKETGFSSYPGDSFAIGFIEVKGVALRMQNGF